MADRKDDDLLAAAGKGDREAFGALVERHHRAVVQFVYRFLGDVDRDTAEDLAQDVFISVYKAAPSFQPRAKVLTWLLRIATNACLNYRRSQRIRHTTPLSGDETTREHRPQPAPGEDRAIAHEEAARIRTAVAALAPRLRAAIVLRHFHDLSYNEIAEVLEVSVPAVESLLFRARKKLRGMLPDLEKNPESPQVLPELSAESL